MSEISKNDRAHVRMRAFEIMSSSHWAIGHDDPKPRGLNFDEAMKFAQELAAWALDEVPDKEPEAA